MLRSGTIFADDIMQFNVYGIEKRALRVRGKLMGKIGKLQNANAVERPTVVNGQPGSSAYSSRRDMDDRSLTLAISRKHLRALITTGV
jgi:hypothetical protein